MINCEHVSVKQTVYWGPAMRMTDIPSPRRWWVNGSDRLVDLVLDAYRTFGVAVWDRMEDRAAGEMGSVARDLPSVQIIRSPEIKHTDQDIPEWVPEAGLEAVARAFARIVDDVNQLDRAALQPGQTTDGQVGLRPRLLGVADAAGNRVAAVLRQRLAMRTGAGGPVRGRERAVRGG